MSVYSYDEIYKINAWRENNIRLVLIQGEGLSDNVSDYSNTYVKTAKFQLCDENGVIQIPSNTAVKLALQKQDGTEALIEMFTSYTTSSTVLSNDKDNGIATFAIKRSMTDVVGNMKGEIRLHTSTGIIKFYGVKFYVYDGISDNAAEQSEAFSDLVAQTSKVEALLEHADSFGNLTSLDNIIAHGGTHPVTSGVIYDYLNGNFVKYSSISSSTLNDTSTHLDTQTIYRFGSQGIIIAANDNDEETQYYFAEDGKMRYRHRQKVGDEWEDWDTQFTVMETTANKTESITDSSTNTQYPTAKAVYDSVTLLKNAVPNSTTDVPTNSVKLDDAINPKYVYRYVSGGVVQGLIIPAATSTQQTQYYFAQDGKMRYRFRQKVNGEWEDWEENDRFRIMINQDNFGDYLKEIINAYISPQNKADKYFVKTCIDKTQVKLTPKTRILGFGDSIMSQNYGGSWMDVVKDRVGCYAPINKAVGGAQYTNNGNNTLSNQLSGFHTAVNNNTLVDVDSEAVNISEISLIVVAGGTNDAYNGTPINSFKTAVNSFFTSLKSEFTDRDLVCPPVLVITPIRRGKESDINNPIENNLEVKIARYSAVINNLALQAGFSVLNGFDIPVLVDDMVIKGVASETATISSFMYKTADSGDAYDDILHVHPNPTTGRSTYAQAVINAIGCVIIEEKSVGTNELDDESVTNGKLASDAVTTNKVLNGNITEIKLSSEVQAKINKRTGVYSYTIPASNWSNNAQSLNLSSIYTVTNNTKVDIEADDTALNQLLIDDCDGIYVENNNGTLTIKAITNSPAENITVQLVVYEVETLS